MKRLCAVLFLLIHTVAHAVVFTDVVIFGDSLSDNGNLFAYSHQQVPQRSWYYQGRYSNGPVWSDYLDAELLKASGTALHLHNYAFGGSGILQMQGASFLLSQEIDSYLLAAHDAIAPDTIIVIWMGANDYLTQPDARVAEVKTVIHALADNISRLLAAGAQHVMIAALPDLGRTPFARKLDWAAELSALTKTHNHNLQKMVGDFQAHYPDRDWTYVDLNQVFKDMMANPQRYDLVNTTDQCRVAQDKALSPQSASLARRSCETYLFYDQVHPTTQVHQSIARYFAQLLKVI